MQQLGNLELADCQGHCPHCDMLQPVDVGKLIAVYGRGASLDRLPPQPCMFCDQPGIKIEAL
jgi:hypothetical protein